MLPVLFKIGPIPIHTYGLMIALGFLAALYFFRKLAAREKLDADRVADLAFWGFLVGFLGSRVLFVITQWRSYVDSPLQIFNLMEGGFVYYGGPLAAIPFAIWYARKHKLPGWNVMDIFASAVPLAQAFGRIGCLGAGCCYGLPTGTDFGIIFDSGLVEPALRGIKLHPTQIYMSVGNILIFLGLQWLFRRRQFHGQIVLSYLIIYAMFRSVIEEFRGDSVREYVIEGILSTSQFISILMFLGAMTALFVRLKQVKASAQA